MLTPSNCCKIRIVHHLLISLPDTKYDLAWVQRWPCGEIQGPLVTTNVWHSWECQTGLTNPIKYECIVVQRKQRKTGCHSSLLVGSQQRMGYPLDQLVCLPCAIQGKCDCFIKNPKVFGKLITGWLSSSMAIIQDLIIQDLWPATARFIIKGQNFQHIQYIRICILNVLLIFCFSIICKVKGGYKIV